MVTQTQGDVSEAEDAVVLSDPDDGVVAQACKRERSADVIEENGGEYI